MSNSDQTSPNILLIQSDQHNARCLGCAGEPLLETPTMDWIANEGVRFSRAYSVSAHCGPSRVSLLTGLYEFHHRRHNNDDEPPIWPVTLPLLLRDAGYQTAILGKGHLGVEWPRQQFEYCRFSTLTDGYPDDPLSCHYFRHLVEAGVADRFDNTTRAKRHLDCAHTSDLPLEHSMEVWLGDETLAFLQNRDRTRPFLAYVNFERPHDPLSVPEPYDRLYDPSAITIPENAADTFEGKPERQQAAARGELSYPYRPCSEADLRRCIAHYYGLVTLIDKQVARILAELDAQDILNSTIIIYMSDHGDFAGEHGLMWKNLGFYEAIHKIPLLIRYPPHVPKGQTFDRFVENIDVMPTLLNMLRLPSPAGIDGRSFFPALMGRGTWTKQAAMGDHVKGYYHMSLRTDEFRLNVDNTGNESELYDHRTDPSELINRWGDGAYATIRERLLLQMLSYRSFPALMHKALPVGVTPADQGGYRGYKWCEVTRRVSSGEPWSQVQNDIHARRK